MPLDAGVGYIRILPQLGPQFTAALQAQAQPALARIGSRVSSIGTAMTKFVTLPIIGIGAAALASAVKVDDALDLIRSRTGAVGQELAGLEADFKAIGRTTPADLMSIADVVSQLNQRLDITGPRLQILARQILESGRILDQGAVSVDAITRLFGDWAVKTGDQTKALELLFKASQQGGGTINSLAEGVVQFGAPLRSLGFTLEESIALWARFQAEGVNTTTVMAGLRMFLSNAAEEGKNAEEAFRDVTGEIQQLAEAGKDAEAQVLAREWFGARTFQDVVRAIQEGRFETEEWVAAINEGGDTILETAKETADFGEQWTIFKNKAILALAPLGERLFPALSSSIETVTGAVTTLVEKFTDLPAGVQKGIIFTLLGAAVAGPFLRVAGGIMSIASSLFRFASGAKAAAAAPAIPGLAKGAGAGAAAPFLATAPGFLAIATSVVAIVAGVKNIGDAAEAKKAAVTGFADALTSGAMTTGQLREELMRLRETEGPIKGIYDWVALYDNIIGESMGTVNEWKGILNSAGVTLTFQQNRMIAAAISAENYAHAISLMRGALIEAQSPLKNLVPSHKQAEAAADDHSQKVKGLTSVYGGIPKQIDVNIDTKLTNYEQALDKLRQLKRPIETPWYIKGIVQPPAGGIPGKVGAQRGFAGTVSGPTLFLAGEGGESEDVLVVPHSKGGIARVAGGSTDGGGGGVTLVIEGDIVIADGSDAEEFSELVAAGVAQGFERLHWGAHGGGG